MYEQHVALQGCQQQVIQHQGYTSLGSLMGRLLRVVVVCNW
jgi:hypothetical protein